MANKQKTDDAEKMKEKGIRAVRLLTVLTENRAAIRLHEKLGFKICRYGMLLRL